MYRELAFREQIDLLGGLLAIRGWVEGTYSVSEIISADLFGDSGRVGEVGVGYLLFVSCWRGEV